MRNVETHIPQLGQLLNDDDPTVVDATSQLIFCIGSPANEVAPELKRIIRDPSTSDAIRPSAVIALLAVTPENEPVGPLLLKLQKSLAPKDWDMPELMGANGNTSSTDIPFARRILNAQIYAFVGGMCAMPVICTGHTKVEVPFVMKFAQGDNPADERIIAISALASLQFDARAAIPGLKKLLKDDELQIAMAAAMTLASVDPARDAIDSALNEMQLDDDRKQQFRKTLETCCSDLRDGTSLLFDKDSVLDVPLLESPNGFARRWYINELGHAGRQAKEAIPVLRKVLDDPDEDTRRMAAEAIRMIEADLANADAE